MKTEIITSIFIYLVFILAIWGMGNYFAKSVSSYEVIEPVKEVNCVVVSRMFNTSVDCWRK